MQRSSLLVRMAAQWSLCALVTASPPPIFTSIASSASPKPDWVSAMGSGIFWRRTPARGLWLWHCLKNDGEHPITSAAAAVACHPFGPKFVLRVTRDREKKELSDLNDRLAANYIEKDAVRSRAGDREKFDDLLVQLSNLEAESVLLKRRIALFEEELSKLRKENSRLQVFECLPYGKPFSAGAGPTARHLRHLRCKNGGVLGQRSDLCPEWKLNEKMRCPKC
ncbi:hypothetical protein niasHS_008258 [Heterodera schachtii]|uniref:Uncharacterized protein n=2 Tax=Heterodera TaxID=34509 RepID=A0ABD2J3U9_HETSC